jgi:hypothetical protein|tara:strand:- start:1074 stop:1664 length:591 start_codon:yes stop_codon:yes gene_type:complete
MGQFPTNDGIIGRTMPLTGLVGTPNALPAWVFQNQTGVLGTNLNGSVLYVGVSGAISVILPGTNLASVNSISDVFPVNGGTLYTNITAATTCSNNMAQGLTVTIAQAAGVIQSLTIVAPGSGYNPGDIITIVEGGRGAGAVDATAVITAVNDGVPVSAQAIEFKGIPAGSILPVAVDYVTAIAAGGLVEADIIVGR